MKHGVHIPNFGPFGSARVVADLAASAEDAGWDGVFIWDHVVRREGDFDVVDPWVALAAAAGATVRAQLGPLITPLPRRRPWNVAKAAVSLDHLSGGRFVLGVGLGTSRGPEFPAFGEETDARRRGDMLDEALALVRAIWSGEPVTFTGSHYRVDGARFLPVPSRPGGIPIWAATESVHGRPVRRAATLNGVFPFGIAASDIPRLVDAVGRERVEQGSFDVICVSREDDPEVWAAAGATWWLRELPWGRPLAETVALVERGPDH
ncbi:MAG TPA: LLM class flavin-dependent oxidoreductase [Acidimicrobiales bacterium]|nr:LLM class flavin-dependent oxidoreductase [Acidimicrobiales bacterium]